jgi:hypothetical protein
VAALSCQPSLGSPILAALFWQSCPKIPAPAVLSWQSCPSSLCPDILVLPVPCWLSCFDCPVLFWLSCFGSPVLAVLFKLSCSGCLFWLSFSGCPLLSIMSLLPYPSRPVLAALPWQLSWLSCPGNRIMFCLSFSACLFRLAGVGCPVLAVLFWLFSTFCPALAVLF